MLGLWEPVAQRYFKPLIKLFLFDKTLSCFLKLLSATVLLESCDLYLGLGEIKKRECERRKKIVLHVLDLQKLSSAQVGTARWPSLVTLWSPQFLKSEYF